MNIGWSKLYSYLTRKPGKYSAIGIEYNQNGLHLCAFKKVAGTDFLQLKQFFPLAEWQPALSAFVDEHQLSNSHVVISFATKKYQLVQADKPPVPDNEIAQALQWSIKDIIVSQDEVVTDYFDLPAQSTGANKVNVVALPKQELYDVCSGVLKAGLFIKAVTVEELCNCDLLEDSSDAVLTAVQDPGAEICLNIIKNKQLYFSRRIRGYEKLSTFTEEELQMGVIDNLSVELQRSMDFFEGQLRQAPARKILLHLDNPLMDVIAKMVGDAMAVDTAILTPQVHCADGLTFEANDLNAIGAAYSILYGEEEQGEEAEKTGKEDAAA
jgi:MSHA biogenesis protein MshI